MYEHCFIGREELLNDFDACLGSKDSYKIMNLYGTAGVGKSFLTYRLQRMATSKGWHTIVVDGDSFVHTPSSFCRHLLQSIDNDPWDEHQDTKVINDCLQTLNKLAATVGVALFIDTFERVSHLEQWLREHFLNKLGQRTVIVLSGRYPLSPAWFKPHPSRRHISSRLIPDFSFEEVELYLRQFGINDTKTLDAVWQQSLGHPFTVSLATLAIGSETVRESRAAAGAFDLRSLPYVVTVWLREVPTEPMRLLVECAAVLRHFNQDILEFVLQRAVPTAEFYELISYSFVKQTERGWTFHHLMRKAVMNELMARTPQRVNDIRTRALLFYYGKLTSANRQWMLPWEAYEFMNYVGDSLVRAYMSWFKEDEGRFEPADKQHREELLQYENKARNEAQDLQLEIFDPLTSNRFRFVLTAEESLYTFRWFDIDQLLDLGYDAVKILKDAAGNITAIAIFIPINCKTIPFLLQNPRSGAYFSSLTPEQRKYYEVSEDDRAGWFINSIHMSDYTDPSISAAVTKLMHSLILTGEKLIAAPPPIPYFTKVFESLGFKKIVTHGMHTHYDGITPAYPYVLDTRGDQLSEYIQGMLRKAGMDHLIHASPQEPVANPISTKESLFVDLTSRQKEVAALLTQGLSNAQIASQLFLSEFTVKKHLKSLFQKFGVASRTQLLKALLDRSQHKH
ncbi:LuxR C-terminal-related transcriptional regulator [Paenibacillus silviterrae]|uniref:LuxR C-terminal-related transcriptional regulator n=1 Tax=Paenibacillus silviterrae TaxID=3242194 RepID=UPI002543974F|nr:LuxR C-terminal-related transcriptional regulator [Paenibacillus chinjuensis]